MASQHPHAEGAEAPLPTEMWRRVIRGLDSPVVVVDADGGIRYINPAAERCFGWQAAEVRGRPLDLLLPVAPEALGLVGQGSGPVLPITLRAQSRTGSPFLAELKGLDRDELTALVLEPVRTGDATGGFQRLLGQAMNQLGDMVWITDRQGVIRYANPAFQAATGYSPEEIIGRGNSEVLKSGQQSEAFYRRLWATLEAGEPFRDVFINRTRSGDLVHMDETITPMVDNEGTITHFVATARDITQRLHLEERLQQAAFYDPLTGLANRDLLLDRAERSVSRARRENRSVALIFLDLRQFRSINQSLGHRVGDEVLKAVGQRLSQAIGEENTIARVGSDRFLILLEDLPSGQWATRIAERLLGLLEERLEAAGQEFFLGAWCGISLYPADGTDRGTLYSRGETALGRAREERIRGPMLFNRERERRAQRHHELETDLHRVSAEDQLSLHFQAQYALGSSELVGYEALVRWHHPRLGPISPAEFIPLLEESGLIHQVGDWILREACRQMAEWRQQGLADATMAVNLSPEQFRNPELVKSIRKALETSNLPEDRLELEITESLLIEDQPGVARNLEALRAMGVAIALDDFGTGYSALSYLQAFPLDVLKLDRSFTAGLEHDPERSPGLIQGVIQLAQGLGLTVVAEGIEGPEQLRFLRSLGCERGQGFGLEPPLAAADAAELGHRRPSGGAL